MCKDGTGARDSQLYFDGIAFRKVMINGTFSEALEVSTWNRGKKCVV